MFYISFPCQYLKTFQFNNTTKLNFDFQGCHILIIISCMRSYFVICITIQLATLQSVIKLPSAIYRLSFMKIILLKIWIGFQPPSDNNCSVNLFIVLKRHVTLKCLKPSCHILIKTLGYPSNQISHSLKHSTILHNTIP